MRLNTTKGRRPTKKRILFGPIEWYAAPTTLSGHYQRIIIIPLSNALVPWRAPGTRYERKRDEEAKEKRKSRRWPDRVSDRGGEVKRNEEKKRRGTKLEKERRLFVPVEETREGQEEGGAPFRTLTT